MQQYQGSNYNNNRRRGSGFTQLFLDKNIQALAKRGFKTAQTYLKRKRNPTSKNAPRKVVKTAGHNENSVSTRAASVINRRNKKVSFKKPKKVKITSNFKAKVKKSLEPSNCYGKYTESATFGISFPESSGNKQVIARLCPDTGSGVGAMVFSPAEVLDVASVLFNGKTATESSKATASGVATDFGSNSFDERTAKVDVKNMTYSVVIRNNSARTWIIQLYEASPRKSQNFIVEGDALSQWLNTTINESGNAQNTAQKNINLAGAAPTTMYASPYDTPAFFKKIGMLKNMILLWTQVNLMIILCKVLLVYMIIKSFGRADGAGAANDFLILLLIRLDVYL